MLGMRIFIYETGFVLWDEMVTRPKSCPLLRFYVSTRTHLEKMSMDGGGKTQQTKQLPISAISLCWLIAKKSGEQKPAV